MGNPNGKVVAPVEAEEVTEALPAMGHSAAGMDRITANKVLKGHQPSVAGLFNIILATEVLPTTLSSVRMTFLPKVECPMSPGDFRLIAISSSQRWLTEASGTVSPLLYHQRRNNTSYEGTGQTKITGNGV